MIELAPNHKLGLVLNNPLMTAAGCAGFGGEYLSLLASADLGAFVTNPVTLQARFPAQATTALPVTGGVLLHNGLPNPGLKAVIRKHGKAWKKLGCPVIAHLAATTPNDAVTAVNTLQTVTGVGGVEVGFRDDESGGLVRAVLTAMAGELPVLVRAPHGRAAEFARLADDCGAQALVVSAPPRGSLPVDTPSEPVRGRLYGPLLHALALQQLRDVAGRISLPLVAAGGVYSTAQARAMLAAGALAVQVDSLLWQNPNAVAQMAADLA